MAMLWLERVKCALRAGAPDSNGSPRSRVAALEQHLADAARALELDRARLRDLTAQAEQLTQDRCSAEETCSNLERDVDLALEEARDDLARYTIVRLLERQRTLERLSSSLARVEEERQNLQALVLEQQTTLAELQTRARGYVERRLADGADRPEPIEDEQVELELLKRKRRRGARAIETSEGPHE